MTSKRIFATILALALILTLLPVTALGAESAGATSLTEAMFTVDTAMEVHTGRPITKTITGQDGGKTLAEGVDYTVAYTNNTNIGTAKITITGMGDYAGTLEYTFDIDVLTDSREDYLITPQGVFYYYQGKETNVVIPEGVTSIGKYAGVSEAVSLTLPSTLTSVPMDSTFIYGNELTSVQVHENNPAFSSQDGVLFNKDKTVLIFYPYRKAGTYTVPDGVKEIRPYAFYGSRNLMGVTLSDSVELVEAEAFVHSSIFYVDFGNSMARVGNRAFLFCDNLTSVAFPEGMKELGYNAFSACHNLKSVVIPKSMDDIFRSFAQCDSLTDVYYAGSQEEWDALKLVSLGYSPEEQSVAFHDNYGAGATTTLTKDMFTVDTDEEVYTGSPITKTITGQDGDKTLVEGTDYTVSYTPNITVGAVAITITGMGDYKGMVQYAFMIGLDPAVKDDFVVVSDGTLIGYRGSQTDLAIPEGLTVIDINAFWDYPNLVRVTIPSTVTRVDTAFSYQPNLVAIQVDENNANYSSQDGVLFNKDKTELVTYPAKKPGTEYTVPEGVETIRERAFSGDTELTELTIPSTVTAIWDCTVGTELTSVQVDADNPNYISQDGILFNKDKTELLIYPAKKPGTEYTIPDGVVSIGGGAFCCCSELESLIIPEGVTKLGRSIIILGEDGQSLKDVYYCGTKEAWNSLENANSLDRGITVHYNYGKLELTKDMFTVDTQAESYTGSAITKTVAGQDGDRVLVEGTDYTVAYTNNVSAGTATITITGQGDYAGTLSYTFVIAKRNLSQSMFTVNTKEEAYTGRAITKTITSDLVLGTDYTVSYANNVSVGTATITLTGKGIYGGTLRYTFSIAPATLTPAMFTVDADPETYTGSPITKSINSALTLGTDYTVKYRKNTQAGTAEITITGQGNYTGTLDMSFTILPKSLSTDMFTVDSSNEVYTGSAITKTVRSSGLTPGVDYVVSYANNVSVGRATLTITGAGNYTGTLTHYFQITQGQSQSKALTKSMFSVDTAQETYTGSAFTKRVSSSGLARDIDYTVFYENNVSAGTAKIVIAGMGDYTGTLEYTFQIWAKPLTASMLTVSTTKEFYTGNPITKVVIARDGDQRLTRGVDYTVTYTNNINLGTASFVVEGKGNYQGTEQYTFSIRSTSPQDNDFVYWNGMVTDYRGQGGKVSIPDGVLSIPDDVFFQGHVTGVTIPGSVTDISEMAFASSEVSSIQVAEDNANYASQDGVLLNKDMTKLIQCPPEKAGTYTAPDGLTEIGAQGFKNCSKLTQVTLPATLTSIGDGAFSGCGSLTDIYYAGSEAEWDSVEGRLKPAPGSGLTIHFTFASASGQLQGESRSLDWSSTASGEVTVTGELGSDETVLLACYDEQGCLLSLAQITEIDRTARMDAECAQAKLFWLGGALQPMSSSALVWQQ